VLDHIMKEATRTGNKPLLGVRNKFIKVHVNSPHVHSLTEVQVFVDCFTIERNKVRKRGYHAR